MILRLKQNLELSDKIFVELKLDLEYFFPKSRRKRNWIKKILSNKSKGRKGVGLKIMCPSKREKESKVKQVRRGVRSPVRSAGKRIMIESLFQIDPKITASCHFLQPLKSQLVPGMVSDRSQ